MQANSSILKLKQSLKTLNQVLEKLPPQHRRLALLGAGAVLLALVYLAIVSPLMSLEESWSQELGRKRQLMVKYEALIASKDRVAQANQAMKAALTRTESQFLSGSNAAVASADLQEILKVLTRDHGVQMTSTKVLQPRDAGSYQEVPVQVQLSGNISQLLTVLYNLEHHKKLLFIPELEINAPRWMAGAKAESMLQVNMVVSGVIKKGVAS
jgi:type II secretory pathway component PulM